MDTVIIILALAPVERAAILSDWDENIDRLTEDEGDVAFLNELDSWDAEGDYSEGDYLTTYVLRHTFCGGCVECGF